MAETAPLRPSILIADDSDVCRTVLAILLKNTGFEVTSVVNGQEALARLRQQKFDLAILDHDMPELNGLGTLTALRLFAPTLPVAICSGKLSPELRAGYEKQGIEALYDKPVDPRKLREQIPAILQRCLQRAAESAKPTEEQARSAVPFASLGAADGALEKPVFAGASAHARKLVANFGRIRDFKVLATLQGVPGAAFLDVAVALAEEKDAVLLCCAAEAVGATRLSKLFAPYFRQTRPVLLIVMNAERLSPTQQDVLDNLIAVTTGEAGSLAGRLRMILCAEASLVDLADSGQFNEMLLMRAGTMQLSIPPLEQRREDLAPMALAVLRRLGVSKVKFTTLALTWLEQQSWSGDYLELHRVIDIARRARVGLTELGVEELKAAVVAEPTWLGPLYHDVLIGTLSGE
jgi:DNA-binding NtrC family response regulator